MFLESMMLAATGTVGSAMGSREAARANDSELRGKWTVVRADRQGREAADIVGQVLTVQGDTFRIHYKGATAFGGTLTLDTCASPRSIDFKHTGDALRGKTWRGIYRIDGDILTVCDNGADMQQNRPTSFDAEPESGRVLVVFKRTEE